MPSLSNALAPTLMLVFTRTCVPAAGLVTLTVGNASILAAYGLTFEDITDDEADNQDESND